MDAASFVQQQARQSVHELMDKNGLYAVSSERGGMGVGSLETSADHKFVINKIQKDVPKEPKLDDGRKKRYKEVWGEFDFKGEKAVRTPDISFDEDWEPE